MRTLKRTSKPDSGFTLLEVLIAIGIITTIVVMTMSYSSVMNKSSNLTRNISTKNRVLSGVREFASMPATLRASMRAAVGGTAINPELLACAGGNPANACNGGVEYAFTMFSPIISRDASGAIMGVQPISAPKGTPTSVRIDSFGSPCTTPSLQCPFQIFTAMVAQCGPPPRGPTSPPPTSADLTPRAQCTVADVIEVRYTIQLDPSIVTSDPELASFVTPVSGSVIVPVLAISGNVPQ